MALNMFYFITYNDINQYYKVASVKLVNGYPAAFLLKDVVDKKSSIRIDITFISDETSDDYSIATRITLTNIKFKISKEAIKRVDELISSITMEILRCLYTSANPAMKKIVTP